MSLYKMYKMSNMKNSTNEIINKSIIVDNSSKNCNETLDYDKDNLSRKENNTLFTKKEFYIKETAINNINLPMIIIFEIPADNLNTIEYLHYELCLYLLKSVSKIIYKYPINRVKIIEYICILQRNSFY